MCIDDYENGLSHIFFFFEIHKVLRLTHELNSVLTTTQSDSSAKMVTDYYSIIRDAK